MFRKILCCVMACFVLLVIYVVFHTFESNVKEFAPQYISEVCGVSVTGLTYLAAVSESALYHAKTSDVDLSQLTHFRKKGDWGDRRNFGIRMKLYSFEMLRRNAKLADKDYSSCDGVYCYQTEESPFFSIMIVVLGDDCEIMFMDRL